MTREDAKTWLNKLYARTDITDEYGDMEDMQPYEEAVDMAIKALSQEPCDDVISREDAIKVTCNDCQYDKCRYRESKEYCDCCGYIDRLRVLPSVQPKAKTGRWIKTKDGYMRCDQCGSRGSAIKARYCHHCGAKMIGEEE